MQIKELVYEEEQDFIRDIQNIRSKFKERNIKIGIVESIKGKTHFIKIFCDDLDYDDKVKDVVDLYISNIIYNIFIDSFKEKELLEYLIDTYFFLKHDEVLGVEKRIMSILRGEEKLKNETNVFCINRINAVVEQIKDCLIECESLNIDGFMRFRSKELVSNIENVIDKIVEEFMVEKEYDEFIKLLQYFVKIQESKIDELHLVVVNAGEYKIKNSKGDDIFEEFKSQISECKIGSGVNIEDIIISGLITNAPKKIIIHNQKECANKEFIETIKNVFKDKVIFCEECYMCRKSKVKI